MIPLYYLFESKQFNIQLSTPDDLLNWMKQIKYGWVDKNLKKYYNFDKWYDKVMIQLPQDLFKTKIGTCYEQTLFEYYIFKHYFGQYPCKMIHIQQFYVSNHSFLIYKKDNKWYYFENSFNRIRGIHGPYQNINQIIKFVKETMVRQSKDINTFQNKGWKVIEMDPRKFTKRMSGPEFYNQVEYDWSK